MRYRILPYRQNSKSAKALAVALGGKVLKLEGSSYTPALGDVLINWGNTKYLPLGCHGPLNIPVVEVLNYPEDITRCSNKRNFFEMMEGEYVPRHWTRQEDIPDDAFPVVCRTVLAGHSGDGIHIADVRDSLVPAPLYVQYVKKKDEYRVHIGRRSDTDESIIAIQRKARRNGAENVNWQVRNHSNGFIYKRNDVDPPQAVLDCATAAFGRSGLDFGAVDVIWNSKQEKAYVLEINTAPGLEGQTITDYATFFQSLSS